jgi:hypothetical protein
MRMQKLRWSIALDMPGDVATQGKNTMAAKGFELERAFGLGVESMLFDGQFNELVFESRVGEDFVNTNEELAFLTVFLGADNFRKGWTKMRLIGDTLHGSTN